MVDIIIASSHGYRQGALRKWILGVEDPMATAIADFPKRAIIVRRSPCITTRLIVVPEKRRSHLGMEFNLPHS